MIIKQVLDIGIRIGVYPEKAIGSIDRRRRIVRGVLKNTIRSWPVIILRLVGVEISV